MIEGEKKRGKKKKRKKKGEEPKKADLRLFKKLRRSTEFLGKMVEDATADDREIFQ